MGGAPPRDLKKEGARRRRREKEKGTIYTVHLLFVLFLYMLSVFCILLSAFYGFVFVV